MAPSAVNLICFAHGKKSGPWGTKIRHMAPIAQDRGFAVESTDYRGMDDPDDRVEKLLKQKPAASGRLVLVGSSMGAYVACAASEALHPSGLFLLAPAVDIPGFGRRNLKPSGRIRVALHGWRDDVVPVQTVLRFCQIHRIELHLLDCGHTLISRLKTVLRLFELFLDDVLALPAP